MAITRASLLFFILWVLMIASCDKALSNRKKSPGSGKTQDGKPTSEYGKGGNTDPIPSTTPSPSGSPRPTVTPTPSPSGSPNPSSSPNPSNSPNPSTSPNPTSSPNPSPSGIPEYDFTAGHEITLLAESKNWAASSAEPSTFTTSIRTEAVLGLYPEGSNCEARGETVIGSITTGSDLGCRSPSCGQSQTNCTTKSIPNMDVGTLFMNAQGEEITCTLFLAGANNQNTKLVSVTKLWKHRDVLRLGRIARSETRTQSVTGTDVTQNTDPYNRTDATLSFIIETVTAQRTDHPTKTFSEAPGGSFTLTGNDVDHPSSPITTAACTYFRSSVPAFVPDSFSVTLSSGYCQNNDTPGNQTLSFPGIPVNGSTTGVNVPNVLLSQNTTETFSGNNAGCTISYSAGNTITSGTVNCATGNNILRTLSGDKMAGLSSPTRFTCITPPEMGGNNPEPSSSPNPSASPSPSSSPSPSPSASPRPPETPEEAITTAIETIIGERNSTYQLPNAQFPFMANVLMRAYQYFLGRSASSEELLNRLREYAVYPPHWEGVFNAIRNSGEAGVYALTNGRVNLSRAEVITEVYRGFLDRTPSSFEINLWNGVHYLDVAVKVAASDEARTVNGGGLPYWPVVSFKILFPRVTVGYAFPLALSFHQGTRETTTLSYPGINETSDHFMFVGGAPGTLVFNVIASNAGGRSTAQTVVEVEPNNNWACAIRGFPSGYYYGFISASNEAQAFTKLGHLCHPFYFEFSNYFSHALFEGVSRLSPIFAPYTLFDRFYLGGCFPFNIPMYLIYHGLPNNPLNYPRVDTCEQTGPVGTMIGY